MQGLATLPEEETVQAALPNNMALGIDRGGNLVQLEDWGSADAEAFKTNASGLETAWLYRTEIQNIVLVEMAHREGRVPRATLLVDAAGLTTAHAVLLPFLRNASVGQRARSFPVIMRVFHETKAVQH